MAELIQMSTPEPERNDEQEELEEAPESLPGRIEAKLKVAGWARNAWQDMNRTRS